MISGKHLADFVLALRAPGTQSVGVKDIGYLPFDAVLVGIVGKVGTAGVTGSQISDVHSITASGVGTTIFSNAAKITYATTAINGDVNDADTVLTTPVLFTAGTLFTLEVDSIHTTAAIHQTVFLLFRRRQRVPAQGVESVAGLADLH